MKIASSETEAAIQARIRLAVGLMPRVRLFRNNSGLLYDRNGRPVRYGVGSPGGSDLIGLTQVTITQAMVGQTLAVFTAQEVKRPGETVPDHQRNFINFVLKFGGIAGVVRSPEDAVRLVTR